MIALALLISAVCSFLFFGVVGQDKTWLMAPVLALDYALITAWTLRKALPLKRLDNNFSGAVVLPIHALFCLIFLLFGVVVFFHSAIAFESKLDLLFVGGVVGSYIVWFNELKTFRKNRTLLGWLVFAVMLSALYGIIIHFKSPEQILWAERYTDAYEGRLRSTYICPNHFAHLMQMLVPFCAVLLFIPSAGLTLKMISGYSLAVFLPTLFLTESRAGWIGTMAAVITLACLLALRKSRKWFAGIAVVCPLLVALLLFGAWKYSKTFQRRMVPVVEFVQGQAVHGLGSASPDFRPQTWADTLEMIRASPVIGHGPGTYRYVYPEYRKKFHANRVVTGHPHNEYLELAADYGWVGFGLLALAWISGLIGVLGKSLKAIESRHALIGIAFLATAAGTMVHSFFDFQMHIYPNAMVFAFLAACAAAPFRFSGKEPPSSRPSRMKSAMIPWGLLLFFLAGSVFCLQTMSSAFLRAKGEQIFEPGDGWNTANTAERYCEMAGKIDPDNWQAYRALAKIAYDRRYYELNADEKLQSAKEELKWYERAYALNAKDPEICAGYASTLIFLGRMEAKRAGNISAVVSNALVSKGVNLLREACSLRKFNDAYWWLFGTELRRSGFYKEALEIFREVEKLKGSISTRANIRWLERQKIQPPPPDSSGDQPPDLSESTLLPEEDRHESRQRAPMK